MLKKIYFRSVPELAELSMEEQHKAFESARHQTFREQPALGAKNLVVGLLASMILPVAICVLASQWVTSSLYHVLLVTAIPALIASPIFQWLQARAIVPVLRAQLQSNK